MTAHPSHDLQRLYALARAHVQTLSQQPDSVMLCANLSKDIEQSFDNLNALIYPQKKRKA